MTKWFLYHHGQVKGPFDSAQVQNLPEAADSLIWGRGLNEWLSYSRWHTWQQNQEIALETARLRLQRQWRARIVNQDYGPMPYADLIDLLKGRVSYDGVWVWTEGYKEWQPIYVFHKLMDDLGVGRRAHPRVPVSGQVQIKSSRGTFTARAMSLSEGGMGVAEVSGLSVGDSVHVTLKNNSFPQSITASAEVVYIENDRFAGLKFTQISSETKSMIIEYIRHYLNQNQTP
jgi:Tfp pilus assembly protein PilZ